MDNEKMISTEKVQYKKRKCPIEVFQEKKDGTTQLSTKWTENKENIIQDLTGTPNTELGSSIILSAITALPKSMSEASKHNVILQALADSISKDAHEARLSAQATVLYAQAMDFTEKARSVLFDDGTFAKMEWHSVLIKTATKFLDLHNKTIETLMRYRQQGEQRIVVQHVTVNEGGKAIVGQFQAGGGVNHKSEEAHGV